LQPWTRFDGSATRWISTHLNQDLDEDLGIGATWEVVLGVTCNDCSIIQLLLCEILTELLVSSHGVN